MLIFWKLFAYISKRLFSTWYLYIFILFLLGMNVFIWVIFPIIRHNVSLEGIFRYRYFFGILILLLAIISIIATCKIFISPIGDGTDILMITRVINRTKLVYSKILTLIVFALFICSLMTLVNLSVLNSPYDLNDSANFVILGSFVGSLIVSLVFVSITMLIGLFCKELTTILIVTGIEAVLLAIQLIMNFMVYGPGYQLKQQENIGLITTNLVSKPTSENEVNETQVVISLYQNKPITLNTKINGVPLKMQYANLNKFIQQKWQQQEKDTQIYLKNAISIQTQWTNLFVFYSTNYLNKITLMTCPNSNDYLDPIQTSQNESFIWNVKFDSSYGYKKILKDNNVDYFDVNYKDFNRSFALTANHQLLIRTDWKNRDSTEYFSQPNIYLHKTYHSLNDKLSFPIFVLDSKSHNFIEKEFNDFQDFAKYYFDEQLTNNYRFMDLLNEHKQATDYNSFSSYYYTLLVSYFIEKYNIDFNELRPDSDNREMNELNELISHFQYATFNFLKQYFANPQEYSWVKQNNLNVMINVLNLGDFKSDWYEHWNTHTIYLGSPTKLINTLNLMKQNQSYNEDDWVKLMPTLNLTPIDLLQTMTYAHQIQYFENQGILGFWLVFSAIIFMISTCVYMKKDFY